jgi:hypothetical protein
MNRNRYAATNEQAMPVSSRAAALMATSWCGSTIHFGHTTKRRSRPTEPSPT